LRKADGTGFRRNSADVNSWKKSTEKPFLPTKTDAIERGQLGWLEMCINNNEDCSHSSAKARFAVKYKHKLEHALQAPSAQHLGSYLGHKHNIVRPAPGAMDVIRRSPSLKGRNAYGRMTRSDEDEEKSWQLASHQPGFQQPLPPMPCLPKDQLASDLGWNRLAF
jgi:hypothetical protein